MKLVMAISSFLMFVLDCMNEIPHISHKSMFGGYGIYQGDNIFAIIAEDVLFFKVDESTKQKFIDFGSKPFVYEQGDHPKTTMNYYELPLEILEEPDLLKEWIEEAVNVSKNSK